MSKEQTQSQKSNSSNSSSKKSSGTKVETTYPKMFESMEPPKELKVSRMVGSFPYTNRWKQTTKGVLHLATRGTAPADVLFVSPFAFLEELSNRYGVSPTFLKGPAGSIFQRLVKKAGFSENDYAYTALARYNIAGGKLKGADLRWGLPAFHADIKRFQPKIIVSLGKVPFDQLTSLRIRAGEMQGAFFHCKEYDCLLYLMDPISFLTSKPEYMEKFFIDLKEVYWELQGLRGSVRPKLETNYTVIETAEQLEEVVQEMMDSGETEVAVDSEWAGQTCIDGKLRAFQFCWKPGRAAAVHFMNEHGERVMDVDDKTVGEILARYFAREEVKYIGHYAAADLVWMERHLGLPIYQKTCFDTMFALQVCDEYADLKLERLALRWTDLGRYDLDLFLWKKSNKFNESDGYGQIPSSVLLPYSLKDADATKRIKPYIAEKLASQPGLADYFYNICLPFVTDGYAQKMTTGLPIDMPYATKLRSIFIRNRDMLIQYFKEEMKKEADTILLEKLSAIDSAGGTALAEELVSLSETNPEDAFCQFKAFCGPEKFPQMLPVYEHWLLTRDTSLNGHGFNYVSTDHIRRWMFDVKDLMPIKSTKKDGITVSWAKVMEMEPERQLQFSPACDKQTLRIYADKDPMIAEVEQLKSVATIVRTYLREPDPDTGEEDGIFYWVQSDGRIHPNFSATETGRPRSWNPNVLNWPKSVTKPIEAAFQRINLKIAEEKRTELTNLGTLPPAVVDSIAKKLAFAPVSLRSCIRAPKGQCFTDADLQTAEVVSLAFLSGDRNMINATTMNDPQFAFKTSDPAVLEQCRALDIKTDVRAGRKLVDSLVKKKLAKMYRVGYDDTVSRVTSDAKDLSLLADKDDISLLRDKNGELLRQRRDVHWEMAEAYMNIPREKLDKELHRGAGKVGMFSIPYGASDTLIERQVRSLTGVAPEPGTGAKVIAAYKTSFSIADQFLADRERDVEHRGYYQSISGRIRHSPAKLLQGLSDMNRREYEGVVSSLKREFRNYPLQEIVAATMARAHFLLLGELRKRGMQSKPMLLLYDAFTMLGPIEERHDVSALLQWAMSDNNIWETPGGILQFEIDVDHAIRWATKLTEEERKLLIE